MEREVLEKCILFLLIYSYLASMRKDNTLYAIKVLNKEKVFTKNLTRYAQTEKNVLSVMSI